MTKNKTDNEGPMIFAMCNFCTLLLEDNIDDKVILDTLEKHKETLQALADYDKN